MHNFNLESGHRPTPSTAFCYVWASFIIWTLIILLLISGISFFIFLRSNLPQVKLHRLDVLKLNTTQPTTTTTNNTDLSIDVQMTVNVTNTNNKITLVYGKLDVDTKIAGFWLPRVGVDGFRQKAMTANELKIRLKEVRQVMNDEDAKEVELCADRHELVLSLKMKGRIEFWLKGWMMSKLYVKVWCEGVQQSEIDQALAGDCNVKLGFLR